MEVTKLDNTIEVGVLYRAETDKAYIVEEIGTNSTTLAVLRVDGAPVAEIDVTVGNLAPVAANLTGPIDLKPCFVVIPPGKTFDFTGATGSYMRLVGKIIILGPGEVLPAHYLARYTEQARKFVDYLAASFTSGAAISVPAQAEFTVLTFTCPVGERWQLNKRYCGEVWTTAATIPRERLATRIYIDDKPLGIVETVMGKLGIYGTAAPLPPRTDLNVKPFSLEEFPIILTPGRTLRITAVNNGPAVTLASGETLRAEVEIVGIKEYI